MVHPGSMIDRAALPSLVLSSVSDSPEMTILRLITGFAALKPILLDSGVYSHLCPDGDRCKAQDTRLNSIFIVASSVNNAGPYL